MSKASLEVQELLAWAEKNGRQPPWRESTEPFGLALAEVLLQKTKANDVEEVWREVFARFPTPSSLSKAPDDEVYKIIGHLGLGRQRTARLKAMARSWESLWTSKSSLLGLGPYGTAIVRFTVGLEDNAVPIDGNIARVVSRYYGFKFEKGELRKKPTVRNAVREALEGAGGPETKLKLLYGLVDLGATVCKPFKPICAKCPLRLSCASSIWESPPSSINSFTEEATA